MEQNQSSSSNNLPEPPAGPIIRTMEKDIEILEKKPFQEPITPQTQPSPPPIEMPLGITPPPPPTEESIMPPIPPLPPEENKGYQPLTSPELSTPETPPPVSSLGPSETIISEKTLTEFNPPSPPKKDIKKLALIAGIVGLAIISALAGWFLYPKIFPPAQPTPTLPLISVPTTEIPSPSLETPTPESTPLLTPTATPISFFKKEPEKTTILEVNNKTQTEFINDIKNEMQVKEINGTLKIIDFRKNGLPLVFNEFATLMGLNLPPELKSLISPEFRFFINSHAQEGNQIGLILYLSDVNLAQNVLKNWENSTMVSDLKVLFFDKEIGEPTIFKDITYKKVAKRYTSFSKPPFSIDYGIYQNFLVIATSRYSFANAIDHLIGE